MDFEFEIKHLILLVNVAVGAAFLGLASALILNGRVLGGITRLVFGVILFYAGFYLYRLREEQERLGRN